MSGPSVAHFPVIRLEPRPRPPRRRGRRSPPRHPGFVDQLWPPRRARRAAAATVARRFLRRMPRDEGTWLGRVLSTRDRTAERAAGEPVTFGKTRSIDMPPGVYSWSTNTQREGRGHRGREPGAPAAAFAAAGGPRPADAVRSFRSWNWPGPSSLQFARLALRPSTASLCVEGGDPVAPARQAVARPARPRPHQQRIQATVTGAPRTSRSNWRATRRRPTRSSSDARPAGAPGTGASRNRRRAATDRIGSGRHETCTAATTGGISIQLTGEPRRWRRFLKVARHLALGDRRDIPRGATTTACWS